jgi:hypothetical protein
VQLVIIDTFYLTNYSAHVHNSTNTCLRLQKFERTYELDTEAILKWTFGVGVVILHVPGAGSFHIKHFISANK